MRCFVTGASGFIGANLVRELVTRGHRVKALVRAGSNLRGLAGLDFERVNGDLGNPRKLSSVMKGSDWCFHVAASYHLWLPDYAPMYATNVDGTRAVLEAAVEAGCSRIVHTSTTGCVGLPRNNGQGVVPSDESTSVSEAEMTNHYKRSKWGAELVAREFATKGAPVVTVNPTAPVGPGDYKPTPTGRIIVDFLNGRMPAYVDTGLNWVHVRDVVVGHILAAERGRVGQRYILGNDDGNWSLHETFTILGELANVPVPRIRIPYFAALLTAYAEEGIAKVTGKPPQASLAGVRMAKHKMFFRSTKAVRELGLPQTPPRTAIADAAEWFRAHGYIRK
jgi:dihydroflavonol-4-reductase